MAVASANGAITLAPWADNERKSFYLLLCHSRRYGLYSIGCYRWHFDAIIVEYNASVNKPLLFTNKTL
jgi:hypothetical protein